MGRYNSNTLPERKEESKRRYEKGKHPIYDKTYGNREFSWVLNPRNANDNGCTGYPDIMPTYPEGAKYWLDNVKIKKERLEKQLTEAYAKWKAETKAKVKKGYISLDEACENKPYDLLKLEGQYDLAVEEVEELERIVKGFEKVKEKAKENRLEGFKASMAHWSRSTPQAKEPLEFGPEGREQFDNDVLISIDGQKVKLNSKGEPIIKDKRSPYNGMPVWQYRRDVVEPWLAAKKEAKQKAEQEAQEILEGKEVVFDIPLPPKPKVDEIEEDEMLFADMEKENKDLHSA